MEKCVKIKLILSFVISRPGGFGTITKNKLCAHGFRLLVLPVRQPPCPAHCRASTCCGSYCTSEESCNVYTQYRTSIVLFLIGWHCNTLLHTIVKALEHGCARVAHCVTARSPTTAVSMTDLRVLSTEKHWQNIVYTNKSLQCKGKSIVRHWTSREATLRHSSAWGTWSVSPQYRDLRIRALED